MIFKLGMFLADTLAGYEDIALTVEVCVIWRRA